MATGSASAYGAALETEVSAMIDHMILDEVEPTRKTIYKEGDTVYVPASSFPDPSVSPFALLERTVLRVESRSVVVDLPGAPGETHSVASSRVHSSSLGVAVVSIGDIASENGLIEPLHKSVLHFMRLLLPDDLVRSWRVRTVTELSALWNLNEHWRGISHVVLVSHAGSNGLKFLDRDTPVGGTELGDILAIPAGGKPKIFISLACESGKASFARPFSETDVCRELVAPFQTIHGASASQYAQALLVHHMLDGLTLPVAKRKADVATTSGIHFRRWKDGSHAS
jgi:hypothetical protein